MTIIYVGKAKTSNMLPQFFFSVAVWRCHSRCYLLLLFVVAMATLLVAFVACIVHPFCWPKKKIHKHIIAIFQLLRPRAPFKNKRKKYEKLHYTLINTSPGSSISNSNNSNSSRSSNNSNNNNNDSVSRRSKLLQLCVCVVCCVLYVVCPAVAIMKTVCGLSGRTFA